MKRKIIMTLAVVVIMLLALPAMPVKAGLWIGGIPFNPGSSNVTLPVNQSDVVNLVSDLSGKQTTLVSATNIKTINGSSILGSGDLTVGGASTWGSITGTLSEQGDLNTALNGKLGYEFVGSSNITTLGTIGTGTWNGVQIGVAYGGTSLSTVAAGSILAANALDTLTAITSTSGVLYLQNNAGTISWASVSGGSNALLDGVSHTDTTAGTVARGDLITGQTATPKWTRLVKGTANSVLSMDATGTDIVWATPSGAPDGRLIVDAVTTGEQHDVTASTALTKVTAIDVPLTAGTYTFKYYIIYRSNQLTEGIRLATSYSGTNGAFVWWWRWADVSATASTSAPDQDQIIGAGAVQGSFASRAKSSTTRGVTLSVDTINADMLAIVEGVFVSTGSGNLELWHGNETATAAYTTSVMIGTSVVVTKTK